MPTSRRLTGIFTRPRITPELPSGKRRLDRWALSHELQVRGVPATARAEVIVEVVDLVKSFRRRACVAVISIQQRRRTI